MEPTRESWLIEAAGELESKLPPLPPVLVSVGFPKGSRNLKGQCWSPTVAKDTITHHIFVSPQVDDPVEAIQILLHELVHAAVGVDKGHRKEFSQLAKKLGFTKPWTRTPMGPALKLELEALAEKVGPYPHILLTPAVKQRTKMALWRCSCGVRIRRCGDLQALCLLCDTKFELQD